MRTKALLAAIATFPIAAATVPAAANPAGQVVLRAKSGTFEFAASLQSYDGKAFVIVGPMGTLTLDAALYDCSGEACPGAAQKPAADADANAGAAVTTFGIHGSKTIGSSLLPALLRGYAQSLGSSAEEVASGRQNELTVRISGGAGKPDLARIDLQRHGSATAFPALQSGAAEIGMADRPVTEDELKLLNVAGKPALREHVVGLDGISVVVGRDSPVSVLSTEQVARIFSGDIADWSAVGQPAGAIRVYAPDAGRGTLDLFMRLLMRPHNQPLGPYVVRMGSYAEIAEAVSRDPRAIGVVSLADAGFVKPLTLRQACGLATPADSFRIKAEEYPLARRLILYTRGEPASPFAQGFLQYAVSRPAQAVVGDARFVDQSVEQVAFAAEEARFAARPAWLEPAPWRALVAQLRSAQRLSITFRFAPGTIDLLPRSNQELARLVELSRSGRLPGRTLLLVGYTDPVGTPVANTALALKRALQVRTQLLNLAPAMQNARAITPLAMGPAAPVACNETAEGQQANRRVEVWIKD